MEDYFDAYEQASYYKWLINIITPPDNVPSSIRNYGILLYALWRRDFFWFNRYEREEDRASDGVSLRERYMVENDLTPDAIPNGPCNVLEMLIAFAIRIDNATHDWTIGFRPWDWIVMFIDNLELADLTDANIQPSDDGYIINRLEKWMSHDIGVHGEHSLFRFRVPVTKAEIERMTNWDMMQYWIIESLP